MYPIGSYVMYSSSGLCRVDDIREETFTGEVKTYYVLVPIGGAASSIFVPHDNEKLLSRIRLPLTKAAVLEYIHSIPSIVPQWIPENRNRQQYFQNALLEGNTGELLSIAKSLYERKQELAPKGKKNLMADEVVLKRAEKIVYGEFAHVLSITPDEVPGFIAGELQAI